MLGCESPSAAPELSVNVSFEGEVRVLELAELEAGPSGVSLDEIVTAAWPELDQQGIGVDFIAADGFRPAARSNCLDLIPVPSDLFGSGFLDPETRDLNWEESLDYPGCLHPNNVETILLIELESEGAMVRVVAGDAEVDVDLSLLPTVDVEGVPLIVLDQVVISSGVVDAPQLFDYDLEGSDGFRPTSAEDREPLPWSALSQGWIDPSERDVHWDEALGIEAAWTVSDVATIRLVERENAPASVRVVYGAEEAEVELGELATVRVDSENLVLLQDVIEAADIVETPEAQGYDFEAADGYRVVEGFEDRVPPSWEEIGLGWIHPLSRNISWDESLDLGAPWHVRDVVIIHIVSLP